MTWFMLPTTPDFTPPCTTTPLSFLIIHETGYNVCIDYHLQVYIDKWTKQTFSLNVPEDWGRPKEFLLSIMSVSLYERCRMKRTGRGHLSSSRLRSTLMNSHEHDREQKISPYISKPTYRYFPIFVKRHLSYFSKKSLGLVTTILPCETLRTDEGLQPCHSDKNTPTVVKYFSIRPYWHLRILTWTILKGERKPLCRKEFYCCIVLSKHWLPNKCGYDKYKP